MRLLALIGLFAALCAPTKSAGALELNTRRQVESAPGSGLWQSEEKRVEWDPRKTALIICDMWDRHWCKGATERVAEMAPRMNRLIEAARKKGVFIIHAPSDTMKFYEGTPQRKRAQTAPAATPPVPLKGWCSLDPTREAPLPIDDSDGGCDDDPQCKQGNPWKRQIATLEIAEEDAITDSAEAYNLLEERGIKNVIVMGVHANMCVLGRPFSIRQMVGVGKNVLLVRDMTDTMYNSRMRPFVSHFRGNDLIVQHIERYWCPSITSVDLLGGEPFRFAKDPENPANKPAAALNYFTPGSGKEQAGPLSPADSLRSFKVFDDLEIREVLAEPVVRQPLHLSWDARGRLWVVQYIQYPAPAGLELVSKDQFWRAVYDKVPPPPPGHFKGADKITIHEDTDGDGHYDTHKTFVEGLNIVTAVEHGQGGVWVLNPPYLLFFPDKNQDDIVDANPEVHLAGFGLEDTHSVANSLRWGPDGWLYGAHGSTVTASIVRPGLDESPIARMMGQGIWRYHPATRRFEVFAEGGGNAFGLELDDKGRIFSGHNGGDTRGFHYVQGGYSQKGFQKHGPLSNPYTFGYFKQMAHNAAERFTHTFVIYGGGALPRKYDGQLFGIEPLQGRVVLSELSRDRSSFKTRDLGYAVTTSDRYFKPVDIKTGPDGALYIADWYDRQVTHTRNYEGNIDKSNGRIYRLGAKRSSMQAVEMGHLGNPDLIGLLTSENRWVREKALHLIKKDSTCAAAGELKSRLAHQLGQPALESLWALNLVGAADEQTLIDLASHRDPHVRGWVVRLLCDRAEISHRAAERLKVLAAKESHVEVRSQLASSARRLPAVQSLPLIRNLLTHEEDADDIHIPLLIWWAIESKAEIDREAVLSLLADASIWSNRIVRSTLLERLMKRYAMAGTQTDFRACARLLAMAPGLDDRRSLVRSLEEALKGRTVGRLPAELQQELARSGAGSLSLAVRQQDPGAAGKALAALRTKSLPNEKLLELIEVFGDVRHLGAPEALQPFLLPGADPRLRKAAISSLQIYDEPGVAETIIGTIEGAPADTQLTAFNVLASRRGWAEALLGRIKRGDISRRSVPAEIVDKLRSEQSLSSLVDETFGPRRELDTEAIDSRIRHFRRTLQSGGGDPFRGFEVYSMACGSCHKLFGEGGQIGPDLTTFNRDDLDSMLMSIVNPSGEIREGYENIILQTKDGRNLSGFLAERYDDALVLRGLDGQDTLVVKSQIEKNQPAAASLMPEGLLDGLEEQQIRDLFAYLRSTQPLVK